MTYTILIFFPSFFFVSFFFLFSGKKKMVQPTISVRKVIATDIQYIDEAVKVVNGAYRSEGK
jgi:hypothetical protein